MSYQIYIADADGTNARLIPTGNPFNFAPQWSPDGQWLMFLSGEHYDCHPYIVRPDGTGLRKIAGRQGYRGAVQFLDVPDFHDGSSDVPVWSPDGKWVYYTAKVEESVELMRASLEGHSEQLTRSRPGSLNYHPVFSPDARWLLLGSTRSGLRHLYVMRPDGTGAYLVTSVKPGSGAMWPHWQPVARAGK